VRHRHGYEQLEDHEVDEADGNEPEIPSVDDEDPTDAVEREVVKHDGWRSLIWSFIASAVLAVRFDPYSCEGIKRFVSVCSILLPSDICDPNPWRSHSQGVAVVFHSEPLVCWSRLGHLSLHEHYSSRSTGIIMGFPTTVSMNLVGDF